MVKIFESNKRLRMAVIFIFYENKNTAIYSFVTIIKRNIDK